MGNKEIFEESKKYMPGGVNSPVRAYKDMGINPPVMKSGNGAIVRIMPKKKNPMLIPKLTRYFFTGRRIMRAYISIARLPKKPKVPTIEKRSPISLYSSGLSPYTDSFFL